MPLRRIFGIVALLLWVANVCAQAAPKRWALVIGIDQYEDTAINSLKFAVADAKLIGDTFRKLGFERVVTLTSDQTEANGRPTRGSILDRLTQIAQLAKPEDTFVLYFSGHGFSDEKEDSYLTTSDCRTTSLDDTALPMSLLQKKIGKIKASHRVFIIDACRNDPMKGGKGGNNVRTEALSRELIMAGSESSQDVQPGIFFLWACSLGERSYELETLGHGAFTYYLSQGLDSGKAAEPDGTVTPYSMVTYVQDQMESWSLKSGHKQRPDYDSKGKARFPIGTVSSPTVPGGAVKEKSTIATMRFTVLDKDGKPVPNPTITVGGKAAGLESRLDLETQKSRDIEVTVAADGFKAKVLQVTLERGKETPIDVRLEAKSEAQPPTSTGGSSAGLAIGSRKRSTKGGIEMVYVPESEFTMGGGETGEKDEKPARKVFLEGYWIGRNDVTVRQFRAYCQDSGYNYDWVANKPSWDWQDDHPMVNVTWKEAQAFCHWAGGDLPTEAQWEKAARGTDRRKYPWGNDWSTSKLQCSKSEIGDALSTAPVGSFPSGSSPYGCLDMAGNVWQWCLDWYGEYDGGATRNPTGVGFGQYRVLRGGCWLVSDPDFFRCADRLNYAPSGRDIIYGFRLAGTALTLFPSADLFRAGLLPYASH